MPNSLNLDENISALIVKALNMTPTIKAAAKLLGVSEKTLYTKIGEYKIKQVWQIVKE